MVFIAPALPLPPVVARSQAAQEFLEPRDEYDGWAKWNRHYWLENYEEFLEFFFSQCFTEPHSTKQREDAVGWGLETDAETLVATQLAPPPAGRGERARAPAPASDCPVLVIHGERRRGAPLRRRRAARGADRRRARRPRRVGPSPARARPGQGQPAAARLRRRRRRRRAAGCAASRAASARSTSRRRSGSATRSATPRSPTSCASSIPTSRSTGSPSTR